MIKYIFVRRFHMKKRTALFILIISVFLLSFSAHAEESVKTIEISADNIEQLIFEYNLDAMAAKLSLDKAKDDFDKLKDDISELQQTYDSIDTSNPAAMSVSVSVGLQLTSLRSNRSVTAYGVQSAEIQYNQLVSARVSAATDLYIACLSDKIASKTSEIKLASLKRKLELAQKIREKGFMSSKQFDEITETLEDQISEISFENQHIDSRFNSLRAAIGIPYETPVAVVPIEKFDFSPLDSLVYEDELAVMLKNSTEISLKGIDLEKAKTTGSKSEYAIKNAEIALEQVREKTINAFKTEFDALLEGYKRFQISYDNFEGDKTELNLLKSKYDLGRASLREIRDKEDELNLAELNLSADENSLYTKYLAYLQTKAGY